MISINGLHASIDGREILRGLNLEVRPGEIHAIMGPNGAGKSTLAKVLAGDTAYEVTAEKLELGGADLRDLEPHERARLGLFMSFQYPVEIPGVNNRDFLKLAYRSCGRPKLDDKEFDALLEKTMIDMEIPLSFRERSLNEGFSGGEKKRNEILQMALLQPKAAILDETDSGLDIDALRIVACGVKRLRSPHNSLVLITHYQRLLDYIQPDFVHVLLNGQIVKTGNSKLALELEERGYDWLAQEVAADAH